MARLTEEMVIARSKQSDLSAIRKLNCWGAELGDVSLLRRMPNVEVLALSINKIRSLGEFAGCRRLRELYVRKNEIADLAEIRHLRALPLLASLWLDENPCTAHPEYRMTVLRNLPNLEKLDNIAVHPDEVAEAARRGAYIPDSDDEDCAPQEEYEPDVSERERTRPRSTDSSPERAPTCTPPDQNPQSPPRRGGPTAAPAPASPDSDERYEHPAMTRSHYEPRVCARSPDAEGPAPAPLRHSFSAHSVKEYAHSTNGGPGGAAPPAAWHPAAAAADYYERPDRSESYHPASSRYADDAWEPPERGCAGGAACAGGAGAGRVSAVMAEHRGFTRRPVARNSNLLSAVLCLVKELDYPSLEVAEMAVRCRMDELANSQ